MTVEATYIQQARQGSEPAWEWIVEQHQQPVFRLAYLLLGDADDAEDVAQETFIRAHHALHRFDSARPIRPWLLRITSNLAKNWRRGSGRYRFALLRLFDNQPPPPEPDLQAEQNIAGSQVWAAIRRLNPADQQIIYLRYFLECSESEAAEALELPVGTVKSRLHRAVSRLRGVLRESYPELQEEDEKHA